VKEGTQNSQRIWLAEKERSPRGSKPDSEVEDQIQPRWIKELRKSNQRKEPGSLAAQKNKDKEISLRGEYLDQKKLDSRTHTHTHTHIYTHTYTHTHTYPYIYSD
jgi:hypothetical protein